jgi:hypothetical protein
MSETPESIMSLVGLWTLALGFGALNSCDAKAADQTYCALYAREQARIDIMHTLPITPKEAGSGYPVALAVQIFKECISILPASLPLTPAHRNLDSWAEDMEIMIQARLTQVGGSPAPEAEAPDYSAQCAAEYRTWDPETGTVIRKGSHERVPCPCGKEVDCSSP